MDEFNSLIQLGLTMPEATVYLALFRLKKASVWTISQTSNIKRPTAYKILESLKIKNLVKVSLFRGVKDYQILSIENLKKIIKKQRSLLSKYQSKIQKQYNKRHFKLRLRIYKNTDQLKTLLEKSLREKSQLYILGNEINFSKYLGHYWDHFNKRAQQTSMRPKFKNYDQSTNLVTWSDKVVFIEFSTQIQFFGFKNQELAELYQFIWKNC